MIAIICLIALSLSRGSGGWSDAKNIDDIALAILAPLKSAIEEEAEQLYSTFEPISYITQVVAGINYKIKIKVSADDYIHVTIYVPLKHTQSPPAITEVAKNMKLADPLI